MSKYFHLKNPSFSHSNSIQNKAVLANAQYQKKWWQKYWKDLKVDDYKNEVLRRQLLSVKKLGDGVLSPERLEYVSSTL